MYVIKQVQYGRFLKTLKKYTQFLLGLLKELDPEKALSEFKTKSKSPEEIAELEEYKDKLAKLKADIKSKISKANGDCATALKDFDNAKSIYEKYRDCFEGGEPPVLEKDNV